MAIPDDLRKAVDDYYLGKISRKKIEEKIKTLQKLDKISVKDARDLLAEVKGDIYETKEKKKALSAANAKKLLDAATKILQNTDSIDMDEIIEFFKKNSDVKEMIDKGIVDESDILEALESASKKLAESS